MLLKAIGNDGALTGTGTVSVESRILGGVLITTNGTNAATVVLRRENSSGKQVFDYSGIPPYFATGPMSMEGTQTLYYDISGTGAAAQLYEWVE